MRARASRPSKYLIICAAVVAQVVPSLLLAAAPVAATRPMYFEHVTMHDGLSQRTVMSVLQDSRGYMWFATAGGLDRYDGYSMHEYRRERSQGRGLASDFIWKIAEDTTGDLWAATDGGGVARWDPRSDTIRSFRHNPSDEATLSSDAVRTLLIDPHGQVWVGTQDHGLDLLDPRTSRVRHFRHSDSNPHSLASDAIYALCADRSGRIWVGTDAGVSRYDPDHDAFVNYGAAGSGALLSDTHIRAMLVDHAGGLWVGSADGGLDFIDPSSGRVRNFHHDAVNPRSLSHDSVTALLEDDAQRLWVGTADGLDLLDASSRGFEHYRHDSDRPESLADNAILSLYQDAGGVLWVGTRTGGVSHWDPRTWRFGHYRSDSFRGTQVSSFAADDTGRVWVGTVGAGLIEIDSAGREHHYGRGSELSLSDDRIMALQYDPTEALWIGTESGGLDRLDLRTRKLTVYQHVPDDLHSLPAGRVTCLFRDRQGSIWIGTSAAGLARLDKQSGAISRYPYGHDDAGSLSSAQVTAIVEDASGNLWIGTDRGGLNLLERRSGRFYHYRRSDRDSWSLSDDTVYALQIDARGQVWVATAGGGLDRVIGSSEAPLAVRFENEKAQSPMPHEVRGIETDHQGHLWLSTDNGLVLYDPWVRTAQSFNEAHGLQGDEFNFNAHHRSADGTLFFGGNDGFNAFQPGDVSKPGAAPRVAVTAISRFKGPLSSEEMPAGGHPLQLSDDDKVVGFDFAALDFSSPTHNRFAYQLEGFDTGWVDAGSLHHASYTNLPAGHYVFEVRAANAYGTWSPEGASIPFEIAASPWNSTAARAAYVLAAVLLLSYAWTGWRRRHIWLLRHNRKLEQTLRDRSSELQERNRQLQELSRIRTDSRTEPAREALSRLSGHVLLVEHQLLDREVALGMLRCLGLQVESVSSGQEALDRARGQRFDAIVMASEMPVMDGYMATMALRAREAGSRVPVIALTADPSSAARDACLTAGMDDFLVKPLNLEALRAMLAHWLGMRSRASARPAVSEAASTAG